MILDELPTLHQVPSLQPGLAESRQFGGCFVLGVQVASALRDLYGRNGAETISGLCGTRVVFAAPDRDTAQWSADSLGRSEVEEFAEGVSYGADPYRDGVTLTPKRELQALALPSEIMRLPNLNGYLKVPGPYPVARIALEYVKRPRVAPRFVPRDKPDGRPCAAAPDARGSAADSGASKGAADEAERPAPDDGPGNAPEGAGEPAPESEQEALQVENDADPCGAAAPGAAAVGGGEKAGPPAAQKADEEQETDAVAAGDEPAYGERDEGTDRGKPGDWA